MAGGGVSFISFFFGRIPGVSDPLSKGKCRPYVQERVQLAQG